MTNPESAKHKANLSQNPSTTEKVYMHETNFFHNRENNQ
jgi:hypothetical protein